MPVPLRHHRQQVAADDTEPTPVEAQPVPDEGQEREQLQDGGGGEEQIQVGGMWTSISLVGDPGDARRWDYTLTKTALLMEGRSSLRGHRRSPHVVL